uniref:StAR related lipid transfer domain containing 6 n=1 Tax=Saimiri boliviensis boliviensis TaxID=39432 RepID=A0A2K6SG14_SAIBB
MDYKAIAQQMAQEVLGYNQDTSGWKVVKTSLQWGGSIVPATQEAETGGPLEPRSLRLSCTMIVPVNRHYSLWAT